MFGYYIHSTIINAFKSPDKSYLRNLGWVIEIFMSSGTTVWSDATGEVLTYLNCQILNSISLKFINCTLISKSNISCNIIIILQLTLTNAICSHALADIKNFHNQTPLHTKWLYCTIRWNSLHKMWKKYTYK